MGLERQRNKKTQTAKFSRLRIIKNLCVISFSFVLLFSAYDGLSMLQSTMNKTHGIGTVSQGVLYVSFGMSSLLLPNFIIKKLGTKNTLLVAIILYIPYIAANFHPLWSTMIPSAVLIGIGASILWGSQCTYFNESSVLYCTLDEDDIAEILTHDPVSNRTSLDKLSECSSNFQSTEELTPSNSKCGLVNCQLSIRNLKRQSMENSRPIEPLADTVVVANCRYSVKHQDGKKVKPSKESLKRTKRHMSNITEESVSTISTISGSTKLPDTPNGIAIYDKDMDFSEQIPRKDTLETEIFETYSAIDSVNACFFGCHGLAYYSSQVWSNLISFYVLHTHKDHHFIRKYECACGADFCDPEPECVNIDTDDITNDMRFKLTGLSVGLGVVAALIILIFLDPLNKSKEPVTFSWDNVLATFNHSKKKEQLFLVPLSLYVGMAQGFYTADITKSYVACAWGTSHIGLVTVFYGLACALSSTVSGCLVQIMGRIPIFLLGQVGNIVNYTFLFMWSPEVHHPFMFYLAAALWGIITGLFWSQLQAFYGVLFQGDEEAAFGSYYLYSSLGWTISFLCSNYICTSYKIYALCGVSCLGIIGYLITERKYFIRKQKMNSPS
ncbi:protein unc-93 homolog A [Caerostris darwini]|uniref:Protein unc-93 homolog A n=1 Tax=Caerostris darwini TaxID=1538125 RepID=A0AAV4X9I7_9ARAC|nr:protein unc-93 homolog A [Caerostris darwini]